LLSGEEGVDLGKRKPIKPLWVVLGQHRGKLPLTGKGLHYTDYIPALPRPVKLEFWFPGQPRAKRSDWADVVGGRLIHRPDKQGEADERRIRHQFLDDIEQLYPEVLPFLPLQQGYAKVHVYSLMTPPESNWWPARMHTSIPDDENLAKTVKDAISGRRKNWDPLLWRDDCLCVETYCPKRYWNPHSLLPHYPKEPGVLLVVELFPEPRHPDLLPPGEEFCSNCGRDDFKSQRGRILHEQRCCSKSKTLV
jgi:hypothetical protein